MIKLKEIATKNRGAFVIDWKGKIHEVNYHGDIFYQKGFEKLMDKAQDLVGYNSDELVAMIEGGVIQLLKFLDNAGCIRGGIWSKDKHQLYFTIDKHLATDEAKMAAIDKIVKYRPSSIYVEDLDNSRNDGYYQADEFAGEYL